VHGYRFCRSGRPLLLAELLLLLLLLLLRAREAALRGGRAVELR